MKATNKAVQTSTNKLSTDEVLAILFFAGVALFIVACVVSAILDGTPAGTAITVGIFACFYATAHFSSCDSTVYLTDEELEERVKAAKKKATVIAPVKQVSKSVNKDWVSVQVGNVTIKSLTAYNEQQLTELAERIGTVSMIRRVLESEEIRLTGRGFKHSANRCAKIIEKIKQGEPVTILAADLRGLI